MYRKKPQSPKIKGTPLGRKVLAHWCFNERGARILDARARYTVSAATTADAEAAWTANGYRGNKFYNFAGVGGRRFTLGTSDLDFERFTRFSVHAIVKTTTTPTGYRMIISKQSNSGTFAGWYLASNNDRFEFGLCSNGASSAIAHYSNTVVNDGKWHVVIVTYDGSSSANGVRFFIDGKLDLGAATLNNLTTGIANSTALQISGRNGANLLFDGGIDTLTVYSGRLSAGEANMLYTNPSVIYADPFDDDIPMRQMYSPPPGKPLHAYYYFGGNAS